MPVTKEKIANLEARMERLAIYEKDLLEKFILASGRGGQKVNKTASCVYLKHLPTGIEVKCSKDRSREQNRFFARRELCDRIEGIKELKHAKLRKQKSRRKRRQKQKDSL